MTDSSSKKGEQTNRDNSTGYQTFVEGGTAYIRGTHHHAPDVSEAKLIDFAPYLQSIRDDEDYLEWDEVYTATTVEGRKKTPENKTSEKRFSRRLRLRAETVKPPKDELGERDAGSERREQAEQWDVLAGLRNYAAEHVLLIGKPGSGKSASLERLLWEDAGRALQDSNAKVPVLAKLRRCTSTVENLIQDAFSGHGLLLDLTEVERLLGQGRLLVLLDGLNELPDEFRTRAANFRDRYRKTTPMIVSTRDLAVGGTLGIDKTLKMLPLTEPQMWEFVRGYLGEEGDRLFQQIRGDRLRKFAETPLLLWMLCRVFAQSGQVPSNLGLAFREFTQLHDQQIQADAPAESREQWPKLLRHLAFALMHDERSVVEFRLSMPREEAEALLTECLTEEGRAEARGCAEQWLQDLLDYHLLQPVRRENFEEHVEFRHQLIQEYYAAEYLLRLLLELSDEVLKRDYLNLLKWTEPLKLLVELVDDKNKTVQITCLALEVDFSLGATLAGAAKVEFQADTIRKVNELRIPVNLTMHLLGLTESKLIVKRIIQGLSHRDFNVRRKAAELLGKVHSEVSVSSLQKALESQDLGICERAVQALGEIRSKGAINILIKTLSHRDPNVRLSSANLLGKIQSEVAVGGLLKALEHQNSSIRWTAAQALGQVQSEAAVSGLLKALNDQAPSVREKAAEALGKIQLEIALDGLLKALSDQDPSVCWIAIEALEKIQLEAIKKKLVSVVNKLIIALTHKDSGVRWRAAKALGKIQSEAAVDNLITALSDRYYYVRQRAAEALGKIQLRPTDGRIINVVDKLLKALEHEESDIRRNAAELLGRIQSKAAVDGLLKALNDQDLQVSWSAIEALGKIRSETAINELIRILERREYHSSKISAEALGRIQSEAAVDGLLKALNHKDSYVCYSAIKALGEIQSEAAVDELVEVLTCQDSYACERAAEALGRIRSETAVDGLLKALDHEASYVRWSAVEALGRIQSETAVDGLVTALRSQDSRVCKKAVEALGKIQSEAAVTSLLEALKRQAPSICWRAAEALGKIQSEAAVNGLIEALNHRDAIVRRRATSALQLIGSSKGLAALNAQVLRHDDLYLINTISIIQSRCLFYNHEIFHNFPQDCNPIHLYIASICYDRPLQIQLTNHLTPLQRQNLITISSQDQIPPGSDIAQTIHQQLHSADIILLLITPDALANETCYQQEILPAIHRHQTGQARTIPILLRPTDYTGEPFSQLDILPRNHQPITTWDNQDEAFREISESVRAVALEIRRKAGEN
ncbi:MAG: HEAT repeat domain-containing protein [Cyanobacteria bacterium P01_A01_bin.135]